MALNRSMLWLSVLDLYELALTNEQSVLCDNHLSIAQMAVLDKTAYIPENVFQAFVRFLLTFFPTQAIKLFGTCVGH